MTTSGQLEFLSEILEWKPVPQDTLVYFRERLRLRLHSTILDAFTRRAKEKGLKRSDLAKRIHRTRAQIARWLSTESNLTVDSISDLMVGLGMDFDSFPFTPIENTIVTEQEQQEAAQAENCGLVSMLDKGTNTGLTLDVLTQLNAKLKSWMEEQPASGASPASAVPAAGNTGGMTNEAKTTQPSPVREKNVVFIDRWLKERGLGEGPRKPFKVAS